MKILHIDETFHPAFGYQCNPLAKFQSLQGNDVSILTVEKKHIYPVYHSFGDHGEHIDEEDAIYVKNSGVHIIRVPAKGYIAGRLNYDTVSLYRAIDAIKPDVMMIHCVETLTAMRAMYKYRNIYPMVFDSHMLAMASQNKLFRLYEFAYRSLITPLIKKYNFQIILTQNDDYVITHLGVPKEQTRFISFGTDTNLFYPSVEKKVEFLKEHRLAVNTFIIVSTGKLSESKNGMLLARVFKEKLETKRPIAIVVVASFVGEYEKEVKKILDCSENIVIYYPVQKYINLPYFYQIADVCVFPKQCSMSFYDAQACGTPVISERNNINTERNSHGNGLCFDSDNVDDFRMKIRIIADMDIQHYHIMRENSYRLIIDNYSYNIIANQYTDVLKDEFARYQRKFIQNLNWVR
jgi:glycosyltransferase involved in cell wall biosynthesis